MKALEPIEIEEAEVERLIEQAQQGKLDAAAQQRIVPMLRTLLWLQRTLFETRISLAKRKKLLFGKRTEKSTPKPPQPPDGSAGSGGDGGGKSGQTRDAELPAGAAGHARDGRQSATQTEAQAESGEQTGVGNAAQKPTSRPGHGRRGVADYPGAERVLCTHDQYQAGDRCTACMRGRLHRSRPLVRLRFTGQPLVNVTHYELEQLRCGACGALFVAHMPPAAGQETYDVNLKVNLAVTHYHLGLPFKRIESFQQLVGMHCPTPPNGSWSSRSPIAPIRSTRTSSASAPSSRWSTRTTPARASSR